MDLLPSGDHLMSTDFALRNMLADATFPKQYTYVLQTLSHKTIESMYPTVHYFANETVVRKAVNFANKHVQKCSHVHALRIIGKYNWRFGCFAGLAAVWGNLKLLLQGKPRLKAKLQSNIQV